VTSQRWSLQLWPTPDDAYHLTGRYNLHPNALTSAATYPAGGQMHAQTILQSCRASADRMFNENIGREHELFERRLLGSIQADRVATEPEYIGFNLDTSMISESAANELDLQGTTPWEIPTVTYNTTVIQ